MDMIDKDDGVMSVPAYHIVIAARKDVLVNTVKWLWDNMFLE